MAPRLPPVLIHLAAFIRPGRLKPDLRVRSIAHVDFRGLRKTGFNAVVVDKDNCVTLPEQDDVYPPYKIAWSDLLTAFDPGRVLIVSNSAGTLKDPDGIAAEAVSFSLRTPVLLHKHPKPACAPEILAYFRGELGKPTSAQHRIRQRGEEIKKLQAEDQGIFMDKWTKRMKEEPLLGPLIDEDGKIEDADDTPLEAKITDKQIEKSRENLDANRVEQDETDRLEEPRIIVIGDRLFTDMLLTHELNSLLPSTETSLPNVLSIHTTALPQPRDVRLLRWIETKLSRGRVKVGPVDWRRYVREPEVELTGTIVERERESRTSLVGRWRGLKQDVTESRLYWNPRTWRIFDLTVGAGRAVSWTGRTLWRGTVSGSSYVWTRARRRFKPTVMEGAPVIETVVKKPSPA